MSEKFLLDSIQKIIDDNEPQMRRYAELLISANEVARLIGPRDMETIWKEHILDCACALPALPEHGSVIDVGTGGGLPGMVWAICRPDLKFTLLDSITRKCVQVEKIAALMNLKNVNVVCERSEDYAKTHNEKFDAAAARAVCTAGILAEYLSPFVRRGGKLISFKGPRAQEEIDAVGGKWKTLGLSAPNIFPCGTNENSHCLVIWEKTFHAQKGYPRRAGMAEKFPWFEKK